MAYVWPLPGWAGAIDPHGGTNRGGADLFAPLGTAVRSITAGSVIAAGQMGPGGNAVQVRGDDGLTYYYAHLRDSPLVRTGQRVAAGTPLGAVGTSGNAADGPAHLHLGIGRTITTGTGADGGTGTGFDAIAFLRQIVADNIGDVPILGGLGDAAGAAGAFLARLADAALWARVLAVIVGAALVITGVLAVAGRAALAATPVGRAAAVVKAVA